MTYKSWWWVTRPKLDLTEEYLTCLLSKIVANYMAEKTLISQRLTNEFSWNLQSLLIIVSPLVERMKN